jgi:hypothetical protein
MLVAAIYDIHANLPALEAVLEEIRQVGADHVVVGGDVLPGLCRVKRSHICSTSGSPCSLFMATATSLCLNRWQGRIQRPCPSIIDRLFAGRRNSFVLNTRGYWLAGLKRSPSGFPG